jgi:hypothetical protein
MKLLKFKDHWLRSKSMDISENILERFAKLYELISKNPPAATLSVIGLLLLTVAIASAYRALGLTPRQTPTHLKLALYVGLIGGILFSAAGPALTLISVAENSDRPIRTTSSEQALDNLRKNARVEWLIRLIPFNPAKQPDLAVSKLQRLGPKEQLYTFVAPYEELRGYRVSEAVRKVGGIYEQGDHVSAIIFSVPGHRGSDSNAHCGGQEEKADDCHPIIPANARGILQVISKIEQGLSKDNTDKSGFLIEGRETLSDQEKHDLKNIRIYSWSFSNYSDKYTNYCKLSHEFFCSRGKYLASKYIGGLRWDWHPIGISEEETSDPCNEKVDKYCEIKSWDEVKSKLLEHFGSRAFLIENLDIDGLPNRYLIDFGDPTNQVIPDIGVEPLQAKHNKP